MIFYLNYDNLFLPSISCRLSAMKKLALVGICMDRVHLVKDASFPHLLCENKRFQKVQVNAS